MSDVILEKALSSGGVRVYNDRPNFPFYEVQQVHGAVVLNCENLKVTEDLQEADGLYAIQRDQLKMPLAIKTADCLPITLLGENGVAHLHAGWRGVHQKIFDHSFVSEIKPLECFIGPAIQMESYEVGEEFLEHFEGLDFCFKKSETGKWLFNLPKAAEFFLKKSYPQMKIICSDVNTFTTPGHNSYRLDKTTRRNYNIYIPAHLW